MEEILYTILDFAILSFEYVGVFIIMLAGIIGLYNCIRRSQMTRLNLARGLALGLEFKMGSEILRTIQVRELREILIVGSIILMSSALAFLIHWEIKNEESHALKGD
jgi:uncharacterized membrane protein